MIIILWYQLSVTALQGTNNILRASNSIYYFFDIVRVMKLNTNLLTYLPYLWLGTNNLYKSFYDLSQYLLLVSVQITFCHVILFNCIIIVQFGLSAPNRESNPMIPATFNSGNLGFFWPETQAWQVSFPAIFNRWTSRMYDVTNSLHTCSFFVVFCPSPFASCMDSLELVKQI